MRVGLVRQRVVADGERGNGQAAEAEAEAETEAKAKSAIGSDSAGEAGRGEAAHVAADFLPATTCVRRWPQTRSQACAAAVGARTVGLKTGK